MNQQIEIDPGRLAPSLRTTLEQFAEGLTAEEQAQLRVMRTTRDAGALSLSLHARLHRSAERLTTEEQARLRLLGERAGAGAAASEESDVQGHMIAQDRVRPRPAGTGGGGGISTMKLLYFGIGVLAVIGSGDAGTAPQPGQP